MIEEHYIVSIEGVHGAGEASRIHTCKGDSSSRSSTYRLLQAEPVHESCDIFINCTL